MLQHFAWPILFQLNIPLGVIAFVLAVFLIPRDSGRKVRFTALSFMGLPVLPLALGSQALVQGAPLLPYVLAFMVTLAVIAFGVVRSRSSRAQLKNFCNQRFNLGCLILLFSIAMHFAVMFTLPAWAHAALGIESGMMGLYFSIIAGSQVLAGPLFGKLLDAHGDRSCGCSRRSPSRCRF